MARLIAAALALALGPSSIVQAATLEVEEIGSFHIGGRSVTLSGLPEREIVFTAGAAPFVVDPNGDFEVEQMYVHFVRLADPKAEYPLLMWHGGGLAGTMWETKPDGHPGWQMYFLRAGHSTYVSDAVERGRASWAQYPEIFETEPFFRTKGEAWELFRIGPEGSYATDPKERVAHEGQRFPIEAFDQFARQSVPRWATNDAATEAAYDELVQEVCPCVLMVFSQSGNFGFNAALTAPDKIKAIIAIEPSGAPNPDEVDLSPLQDIPHLFVWGDYLDQQALWRTIVPNLERYRAGLEAAGVPVTWIDLPERGITGNTHMLMMDRNSDEIAALVQDWIEEQGLMKE